MLLLTIAEKLQQEQEHIDEIQIQAQRPHNGFLFGDVAAVTGEINTLNILRVIGRQSGKNQHTNHRNGEMHGRALHEEIDDRRQNNADKPHKQERAHAAQIALGGVAVKRQSAKEAAVIRKVRTTETPVKASNT